MDATSDSWFDAEAGPVVRPYAMTKGRTQPSDRTPVHMIDLVQATGQQSPAGFRLGPEHRQILGMCRAPTTVVDLTSDIDLPIGVVLVLVGDLIDQGLLQIRPARQEPVADVRLLRDILDGLRAL